MSATPQEIHRLKAVLEYLERIPEEEWCKGFVRTRTTGGSQRYCVVGQLHRKASPLHSGLSPAIDEDPGMWIANWDFVNWLDKHYRFSLVTCNDRCGGTAKENVLRALRSVLKQIEEELL